MTQPPDPSTAIEPCATLTIILGGQRHVLTPLDGETILETTFRAGLRPPVSCLAGSCATCIAHVLDGRVEMLHNDALTEAEIAMGYVLTCQGQPRSAEVTVVYED